MTVSLIMAITITDNKCKKITSFRLFLPPLQLHFPFLFLFFDKANILILCPDISESLLFILLLLPELILLALLEHLLQMLAFFLLALPDQLLLHCQLFLDSLDQEVIYLLFPLALILFPPQFILQLAIPTLLLMHNFPLALLLFLLLPLIINIQHLLLHFIVLLLLILVHMLYLFLLIQLLV